MSWAAVWARIVGWSKRDDGTINGDYLVAEFVTPTGIPRTMWYPVDKLPLDEWEQCTQVERSEDYDQKIEDICSGFAPRLLISLESSYLPASELQKRGTPYNPWRLREEFLGVKPDEDDAITFLGKFGAWSISNWMRLKDLTSFQSAVREALTSGPGEWFKSSFSSFSGWNRLREYPYFGLRTNHCKDAIAATVSIDLLNQAKFRVCARGDCGKLFELTSKHKRKYCCQYCGHLESVRKTRGKPKA